MGRESSHTTGSTLTHLEGALSRAMYPADELATVDPTDNRPLLARYDLEKAAHTLTVESLASRRRTGGMWRWAELLPVRDRNHITYLGEGDTPLLPISRLGKALGVPRFYTKVEGINPTGSFKARGMAAAVSRSSELGATSFIAPSAGMPPVHWRPMARRQARRLRWSYRRTRRLPAGTRRW
jgi:threonine synthase